MIQFVYTGSQVQPSDCLEMAAEYTFADGKQIQVQTRAPSYYDPPSEHVRIRPPKGTWGAWTPIITFGQEFLRNVHQMLASGSSVIYVYPEC